MKTIAKAAGESIGHINVWVHRGLIPGLVSGRQGQRRDIDDKIAMHIVTMAELCRFGFTARRASSLARIITYDSRAITNSEQIVKLNIEYGTVSVDLDALLDRLTTP